MAKSGSFNTSGYDGRYLQFSWSIASTDIANNKTTINWELTGAGTGGSGWYYAGNFKVVIDGSTVYSSSDRIQLWNGTKVASGTKTITHNSNGTRSFSASAEAGIYNVAVNCTGSGTFTLEPIPRSSSFTVSNASADMGTAVTFTINRASTAFTHKLILTWNGQNSDIASGVGDSFAWTIPLSLANALPNSTLSSGVITCITYSGSTEIGRASLSMTLKVPSSVKPNITGVTISDAISGISSKFGAYIQSKSRLNVVIAASGSYSSTIKSYSTKILNKTYEGSTFTSNAIDSSGTVSVVVTVTDSRGRTNSTTKTVTVLAYADPKITAFSAVRCNNDGTLNDEGEYVQIAYAFNVTALNNKNDKSFTIAYKLRTDSEYTTLATGNVYSADTTIKPTAVFNLDNAYDFMITVTDYFRSSDNPVILVEDISTAFTLMDFHSSGFGMSIGKVSEKRNTLEIALDVEFIGKVRGAIFDAIYPVGSIYLAYNHTNPASLFGGTWERLENAFLWASSKTDTIGDTGGEKTHKLTVDEIPSHKHQIAAYKSTDGNGIPVDAYSALAGSSTGSDTTSKYYTNGSQNVGGSQPHNNMPPYIQVSAWRRTA